jgi:ribonuclease Z
MYQINSKEQSFPIEKGKPATFTIKGYSRGAYKTGYIIKPYNIYLDAGLQPVEPANLILLSHSHYDHIASLYIILDDAKEPTIVLPKKCISKVQTMLESISNVTKGRPLFSQWNPIGVEKGVPSSYSFKCNNTKIKIVTFPLTHSVECIGFNIFEIRDKLKPEFSDLSGKEIAKLKKTTQIHFQQEIPILMFVSDTDYNCLPSLNFKEFNVVIIECTFIEPSHLKEAINRNHLHWSQLAPYIMQYSATIFILGHFSCRYKDDYLKKKELELKETYQNIIFWI